LKHSGILIICTHFGRGAAYRRLSYFIKYFKIKKLRIYCAGFLEISGQGLIKPSRECYEIPFIFSTSTSNYVINFLLYPILSLVITLVILILRPKIVIVSIPDFLPVLASYLSCFITRSKLIIDVRDPQEEILVYTYRKGLSGLIARFCRRVNYSIYRRTHTVVAVTSRLVTMLVNELRRPVHLVPNGADLSIFKPIDKKVARFKLGLSQDSFVIGYIGYLSSRGYYNILPILLVIRRIRRELGVNIKLIVAGPMHDASVKRIVKYFKEEFAYMGVLDTKDIIALLSACDVGLIPRIKDPIYDYAIPAKFYEYVAMALPLIVLANNESELAKTVKENKLGFVCNPDDQVCLEDTIVRLATNRHLLNEIKRNVLTFRKYVDRSIGAERLFKLVTKLLPADQA